MKRLPTFTLRANPIEHRGELIADGTGYKVWRTDDAYVVEGTLPPGPVRTLDGGTLILLRASDRTALSSRPLRRSHGAQNVPTTSPCSGAK